MSHEDSKAMLKVMLIHALLSHFEMNDISLWNMIGYASDKTI